jgi:hypothetical protein
MKRAKSPQLKKQDSYDKDHRTAMENPHAFRKNWPKKKSRANRRDRVALRSELALPNATELTAKAVLALKGKRSIVKSHVSTLRQSVRRKAKNRLRQLLKTCKGPNLHGELFNDAPQGRKLI